MLTPSFFDEAPFDFEEPNLPPCRLFTPQLAGDCPDEVVQAWDQIGKHDLNSRVSSPIVSSERDNVFFPGQFGSSPDDLIYPSLEDPTCSVEAESCGAKNPFRTASSTFQSVSEESSDIVDLYNQMASLPDSCKR